MAVLCLQWWIEDRPHPPSNVCVQAASPMGLEYCHCDRFHYSQLNINQLLLKMHCHSLSLLSASCRCYDDEVVLAREEREREEERKEEEKSNEINIIQWFESVLIFILFLFYRSVAYIYSAIRY